MFRDDYQLVITLDSPHFSRMSEVEVQEVGRGFASAFQAIVNRVGERSGVFEFSAEGESILDHHLRLQVLSVRGGSIEIALVAITAAAASEMGKQVIAGVIVSTIGAGATALWNKIRRKKAKQAHEPEPQPVPVVVQTPSPRDISPEFTRMDERQDRITTFLEDGSITIREVRTRRWVK